jgi:serine/threonine protein kinase
MHRPLKFGKYLLLERIAVGGMAEVYAAKAFGVEGFERIVAIKKILPTLGEDPEFVSMFVDEARIAVQLSHANIVQVFELGKHDDSLYIAMEYVAGRDVRQLAERYRRHNLPMPVPQACAIVARACEALDHAHRKCDAAGKPLGIVHRDVSPQNVLVSFEGDVKLIDFGIAKAETRLQRTQSGILKGKFSYMSPEQVQGQPIDRRSDVFAAGVLLWELLCGRKLFTGDTDLALLDKVRRAEVPPPRSIVPEIPEALEAVVLKALTRDPADRYQWCSELHDDLVRFTFVGDAVFSSRRLAEWMRQELSAEYENEQARMRQWLAVHVPAPVPTTDQTAMTIPALADAETARGVVRDAPEWRLVPDRDTVVDATSGTAAHPTVVLRPGEARAPIFDNSSQQTAALRADRVGPLTRPPPRRARFRKLALAGAPLAAAVIGAVAYLVSVGSAPRSQATAAKKQVVREGREPPPQMRVAETSVAPVSPAAATRLPEPRLHIVSDPVGAEITLSGRKLGRAPLTTDPLATDTEYEVAAALKGYQSVRRVVRTNDGVTDVTLFLLTQHH